MDQSTSLNNLAFLFKDAKNNQIKLIPATPTKIVPFKNQRTIAYIKASEVEALAKEGTILDINGEIASYQVQSQIAHCTPHMVTVPISNPAAPPKMSPFKTEPAILPKPSHIANSPMILGTPQRVNLVASPRTPQSTLDQANSWSGKRTLDFPESEYSDSGKRSKKGEKGGKGLRHFSMKVCEKVQKKGITSYNEVADELVAEFSDPQRSMSPTDQAYDQKNIRRRVYDALNVLMAMNIISKEKKEIKWLGLPTNSAQECQNLEQEKQKRLERIGVKKQQLHELILQQIAFKNLVLRNKQLEKLNGPPTVNTSIQLPFIIVNTSKETIIDCSISSDKMEYLFNFNNTFEIHDDIEVLKRMGMTLNLEKGSCTEEQLLKIKQMVPKSLERYISQIAHGSSLPANSNSIVAGPSGINSGTDSVIRSEGSDSRNQDSSDTMSQHDGQDLIDLELTGMESGSRRLSRQSSMTSMSDNVPCRLDIATTSDDEDFSASESEDDDDSVAVADMNQI